MKLTKTITLSVITIVVAVLFAGAAIFAQALPSTLHFHPPLAYQQAFRHGHGGAYAFYGPCITGRHGFSYTWCLNPL